jgi:hypothetical protein
VFAFVTTRPDGTLSADPQALSASEATNANNRRDPAMRVEALTILTPCAG